MSKFNIITAGSTPLLIHSSTNVAKQIYDTANFIRKHMNRNSMLTIIDPQTEQRITMMYPIEEWEHDIENVLCEYCAKEDSYIHSVTKSPTTNHIVVAVPLNNKAFTQNAVYIYSKFRLEYMCSIKN